MISIKKVLEVKDHVLVIEFSDKTVSSIDMKKFMGKELFSKWFASKEVFSKVSNHTEGLSWENGFDQSAGNLYALAMTESK